VPAWSWATFVVVAVISALAADSVGSWVMREPHGSDVVLVEHTDGMQSPLAHALGSTTEAAFGNPEQRWPTME
jgi:hypothetical protein